MKETSDRAEDAATKRKRRKGGMSFSNSKQRKRRELKKKDLTSIDGRGTPSDLSKQNCTYEIGQSNPQLNLDRIEEEKEESGSLAQSMAESEHPTNSNQSGSREERREDSISSVRLNCVLMTLDVENSYGYVSMT